MNARQEPSPDASSRLCLSCGMCCDGSLFARGRIEPGERQHWEAQGLDCFGDGEADFFLQSCPCLEGTSCTLFGSGRPAICGSFRCEPLRRMEAGDTSLEAAQATIRQALDLKAQVVAAARSAGVRYRNFLHLKDELARAFIDPSLDSEASGKALIALALFHEFTEAQILPDEAEEQRAGPGA